MDTIQGPRIATLGPRLVAELGKLEAPLQALWEQKQHPHYTLHDLEHSQSIIRKLNAWFALSALVLSEHEVFVLTAAAYLHDIGMQCGDAVFLERYAGVTMRIPLGPDDLAKVRNAHHQMSAAMVRDACGWEHKYRGWGLDLLGQAHLYNAVALLCWGHAERSVLELRKEVPEEFPVEGGNLRLLLLAHLLRIGDALDATENRVNKDYVRLNWSSMGPIDRFHTLKHQYVASVDMVGPGVFRFTYALPEDAREHYAAIATCAEKPLRDHIPHARDLLGVAGLAFENVARALHPGNPNLPFRLDKDTLAEFGKAAGGVGEGGPPPPPAVNTREYRRWLREGTSTLRIRGLGQTRDPLSFALGEIYIDLLSGGERRGAIQGSLSTRVNEVSRVLLTGVPGSGKTTFLQRYALGSLDAPGAPLPLYATCYDLSRFFAGHLPAGPVGEWRYFVDYWLERSQNERWGFTAEWMESELRTGGLVIVLDQYEDVPAEERRLLTAVIDSATQRWPESRWILAARPGAAHNPERPARFEEVEIAPLEMSQVRDFIHAWSSLVDPPPGQTRRAQATELLNAIVERSDLRSLATRPVMLTALAVIHWNRQRLPQGTAQVVDALVEWLLQKSRPAEADLRRWRRCYATLALAMFLEGKGEPSVPLDWAAEKVLPVLGCPTQDAINFLRDSEDKTGILVRDGEHNVRFWHAVFQEYLAACQVVVNMDAVTPPEKAWSFLVNQIEDARLGEVARFVAARLLILERLQHANQFVLSVLDTRANEGLEETARVVGAMGTILYDLADFGLKLDDRLMKARNQVLDIFTTDGASTVPWKTRFCAAVALGRAGDPRLLDPEKNWVPIRAGVDRVGADAANGLHADFQVHGADGPSHEVFTKAFECGRYPVTVEEFRAFRADGGYQERKFWDDAGWVWKEGLGDPEPWHWSRQLQSPNLPVVGISWFEARAYCAWLSQRYQAHRYVLPTEAEWEYAVRLEDGAYQRYVCGNHPPSEIREQFNTGHSVLDELAPIGFFPQDRAGSGVADVNGNILEWTRSPKVSYGPDLIPAAETHRNGEAGPDLFAVRGGPYYDPPRTTAERDWFEPSERRPGLGFRVIRFQAPVRLKGRLPGSRYDLTLADLFAKHAHHWETGGTPLSTAPCRYVAMQDIMVELFPGTGVNRPRLPVVMGDPRVDADKRDFNLHYQDARIKLAVEDKRGDAPEDVKLRDAREVAEDIAVLLNADREGAPLWSRLTDYDLTAIVYAVLAKYDSQYEQRLVKQGKTANAAALSELHPEENSQHLLVRQVFAGARDWCSGVWHQVVRPDMSRLGLDDTSLFLEEVGSGSRRLLFFFADNGELVWDLAVIRHLLKRNRELQVTAVVNTVVAGAGANRATLEATLEAPIFCDLRTSVNWFYEPGLRPTVDLSYCTEELRNLLRRVDLAFIKGGGRFETLQDLPVPAYYGFVVSNRDAQKHTGFPPGTGLFARVPAKTMAYKFGEYSLKQWRADSRTCRGTR
jgi:formylglycine-generating enzyme required for sulfatase activity